jgi:hypothetical protein
MSAKYCEFQCPVCGWWANDDQLEALVERTAPEVNEAKAHKFGVTAYDWRETWCCPNDGTIFSFTNSNC